MAYLDTAHLDGKARPEVAWEAFAARLDGGRSRLPRPSAEVFEAVHVKRVQQMLLAAAIAGGAIIAIAGVMLLGVL